MFVLPLGKPGEMRETTRRSFHGSVTFNRQNKAC
jgi:hypothetical protein